MIDVRCLRSERCDLIKWGHPIDSSRQSLCVGRGGGEETRGEGRGGTMVSGRSGTG